MDLKKTCLKAIESYLGDHIRFNNKHDKGGTTESLNGSDTLDLEKSLHQQRRFEYTKHYL